MYSSFIISLLQRIFIKADLSVELDKGLVVELMDEGFLVDLVAELELVGQRAELLEGFADALELGDVVVVRAPEGDTPVLITDREYRSVNQLVAVVREEAADHGEEEVGPGLLTLFFHVFFNRESDDPLAALAVVGVLPLWSDTLAEHQVVSVGNDLIDLVEVVKHPPEVLHSAK